MGNDAKEPLEPRADAGAPPAVATDQPLGPAPPADLALGSGDPKTLELDGDGDAAALDRFAPGATYGHFVVRRLIGAGGMGVVLEAHDPDLDRTVAIKVVRGVASASRARDLVSEAQAMARLSDPNVVTIYEVGRADGEVFLVMEHVIGVTLAGWLEQRARTVAEVTSLFVAAGAGLVAAHDVGLIHRDFKPSNVLVDRDGRPRVTDFGIARFIDKEAGSAPAGTAGYMAPEQVAGDRVDHRADQYAFCVALREAVADVSRLPTGLERVLERGTAVEPSGRYASMRDLLRDLEKARAPRRAWLLGGPSVVAGLAAVAASFALMSGDDERSACMRGVDLVDGVWTRDARAAIELAFVKTGRNHASVTSGRVATLLDGYADSWKLGRRAACEAEPSVRLQRLSCLDGQLGALGAQVGAFSRADTVTAAIVDHAVRATIGLPPVNECAHAQVDAEPMPPASHPVVQAVDELAALQRSGELAVANERIAGVLADAEKTNNKRLLARALLVAGRIESDSDKTDDAREHLARAARTAGAARDDLTMGDALIRQASAMIGGGRPGDALGILDAADAVITRAGLDELRARLRLRRGEALAQSGRGNEGIPLLQEAVAEAEERASRDPKARIDIAVALGLLSAAHTKRGDYPPSREAITRAMAIEKEVLGAQHPEVASSLHDLAVTEVRMGESEAALAHYEEARAVFVATYGEDHPHIGRISLSLGNLELLRGRLEPAEAHYERARANLEKALGADHPHLAIVSNGLAAIYRDSDRCKEADPYYRRSIEIYDKAGVAGLSVSTALTGLGVCLMEVGDASGSKVALERALEELAKAELDVMYMAEPRAALAQTLWIEGRDKKRALALARTVIESLQGNDEPSMAPLREEVANWIPEWESALP